MFTIKTIQAIAKQHGTFKVNEKQVAEALNLFFSHKLCAHRQHVCEVTGVESTLISLRGSTGTLELEYCPSSPHSSEYCYIHWVALKLSSQEN